MHGKFAKPEEVLGLHAVAEQVFALLKEHLEVADEYVLDLTHIDSAHPVLRRPYDVAALAMRKVQALRLVSRPGERTSNDVVVGLCAELTRALSELGAHLPTHEIRHELDRLLVRIQSAGRAAAVISGNDIVELE